jgi:hypothetical protein
MPTSSATDFAAVDPPSIQEARGIKTRQTMRRFIIKDFLKWAKKHEWKENNEERLLIRR